MLRRGWIAAVVIAGCGPDAGSPAAEASGTSSSAADESSSRASQSETGAPAPDLGSNAEETSTDDTSTGGPNDGCDDLLACGDGCLQWESLLQGEPGVYDWFDHVAIASDATILVTGLRDATDTDPGHAFLRRYDADGELLEELLLFEDATGLAERRATGLALAPDGRIAVIGTLIAMDDQRSAGIELRAADGALVATDVVAEAGIAIDPWAVAFASDDALFVGGIRDEGGADLRGMLRRYDAALGFEWERTGDEIDSGVQRITRLVPAGDGELLAIGVDGSPLWVGRIANDGTLVWGVHGETLGRGTYTGFDLAATPEGDAIVVGSGTGRGGPPRSWVARFDGADGDLAWTRTVDSIIDGIDVYDGVVVDDGGRIFVAGREAIVGLEHVRHVQQLDCDGDIAWEWVHVSSEGFPPVGAGGLAWSAALGLVATGSDLPATGGQLGFLARLVP